MPKELTHILIAQDVLKQLRESGQQVLAQVIEKDIPAFYLGAIIPDAFFYDVPPFRLNPKKYVWISRILHQEEKSKNDQKALGLFDTIAANTHAWPLTLAFAAGIITHTVGDRIIHGVIDHYTTTWGQKGSLAPASHRQIETLLDMVLLRKVRRLPGNFRLKRLAGVGQATEDCLFRFYLGHLTGNNDTLPPSLIKALRRAFAQQCLFINLFTNKALYHIVNVTNKLAAGRLHAWSTLFYPDTVETRTFPILDRIDLNALTDGRSFAGTLASLMEAVTREAITQINLGVRRLA